MDCLYELMIRAADDSADENETDFGLYARSTMSVMSREIWIGRIY